MDYSSIQETKEQYERRIQKNVAYLQMAKIWGKLSRCERKQVGALIVKDGQIISEGYNGTPKGHCNDCEKDGVTHWYTLHAEANAILKVARSTQSSQGSTLFVTLQPCKECCKLIIQSGIKEVIYEEEYRDPEGLELLRSHGVIVTKYQI